MATDPYRTLGLPPDATLDEIKRAYRRLAKVHHPDTAGDAAVPRFLAVQAAYEALLAARGPRLPGRSRSAPAAPPARPSQADPERAGATWEQARRRRASGAGPGSAGPGATDGDPGPADPGPADPGPADPGPADPPGPGRRPGSPSGPGTRKRRTAKAGSTTYDEAREATDPTWHGAIWYGTSSGEYWTLNPREYADPRKHGPEYQARARRSMPASGPGVTVGGEDPATPSPLPPPGPPPTRPRRPAPSAPPPAGDVAEPAQPEPLPGPLAWFDAALDSGRLAAFAAWPPIGIALATLANEATGCARSDAACDALGAALPWLAQAVVLGLLLAAPTVARLLARGTAGIALAVVPVTGVLLVLGAGGHPAAAPVMLAALAVAWAAGLAWPAFRQSAPPVS